MRNLPNDIPMLNMNSESFMDDLDRAMESIAGTGRGCNRERPYDGQSHTDQGKRGMQKVEGLTIRDIVDCYVKGFLDASGRGALVEGDNWSYNRVYEDPPEGFEDMDPMAVAQNMMCEIEKMMGIYPNIDLPLADDAS